MKINHSLIGTIPEVEHLLGDLPRLLQEYEKRTAPAIEQISMGVLIEMCAQHFYGINVNECTSMREVVKEVRARMGH